VEVDPVQLVRGKGGQAGDAFALQPYVNDRPYVASSFLSVALAEVFGTALSGRSKERHELADTALPLEATISVLPSRGEEALLHRLFKPLGYEVRAARHPLDERFPEWGESPYVRVTVAGSVRLRELLSHLYVLIPVLDDDKHYWVGQDEIEKLLRHGGDWLASHPERNLIADRYLVRQRPLTREALARLAEDSADPDEAEEAHQHEEAAVEERISLHEQRHGAVLTVLRSSGGRSVLDLGCGEGRLLAILLRDRSFERITGMDVSHRNLERAARRLRLDRLPPAQHERISLIHGSLSYRDRRLEGYDAATVVEVIEHLDPSRLAAFERVLFECARPGTIILTTPNVEYNAVLENLPGGKLRHRDHRFEWTRAEFRAWAEGVAGRHGYAVRLLPVGPEHPEFGPASQMAVFGRV
jgi:3' terminal RNA ribose 2'-O-methyltransferase Hen1